MSISLVMITKNEEKNIGECFKSVQSIVSEIVLVDIGSTDKTVVLAESLGANVHEFTWTYNCSAARNFGIELASTPWILVLDADERLHPADKQLLKELIATSEAESFMLSQITSDGSESTPLIRLFRNKPEYRFRGRVHEIITPCSSCPPAVSTDVRILHTGYASSEVIEKNKLERNLRLLKLEIEERPDDPRLLLTIGQHLEKLNQLHEALPYLKKAASGKDALGLPVAFRDLANVCLRLHRYELCRKVLDFAIRQFPDYTDLFYISAKLHKELNELTEAQLQFQQCIDKGLAPKKYITWKGAGGYLAWQGLGDVMMLTGSMDQAEEAFRRAVELNEEDKHSLARLASILAQRISDKQLAKAEFLEIACGLDENVRTIMQEVFGDSN